MPRVIVLDRDLKYIRAFWMHFLRKVGMKLMFNMAFYSQIVWKKDHVNEVSNHYLSNLAGSTFMVVYGVCSNLLI